MKALIFRIVPRGTSKAEAQRQDDGRIVQLEHGGREVDRSVRKADAQPALNVHVALVRAGSLDGEAEAQPLGRRPGEFGPGVEEALGIVFQVEEVFAFAEKIEAV